MTAVALGYFGVAFFGEDWLSGRDGLLGSEMRWGAVALACGALMILAPRRWRAADCAYRRAT